MSSVILIRGIPASGKTTLAKALMDNWFGKICLVSKDDIRRSLFAGTPYESCDLELVEEIRNQTLRACLAAGCSVVMDETFIEVHDIESALAQVGEQHKRYLIDLKDTPFDVCYKRNIEREHAVPFEKLFDAWLRLQKNTLNLEEHWFDTIAYGSEVWSEIQARADHHEGIPAS